MHKPTGIQVRSHKTRYMEINRRDAFKLLERELDQLINGDSSKAEIERLKAQEAKRQKSKKAKKKYSDKSSDIPSNVKQRDSQNSSE